MSGHHKYKVGQHLEFSPGRMRSPERPMSCKVLRLLPAEDGQFQYRIKCTNENIERVVKEYALSVRS